MTNYKDIPSPVLRDIIDAPTTYQALQKALAHLVESQHTYEAMARTMDTLMESDTKPTSAVAEVVRACRLAQTKGSCASCGCTHDDLIEGFCGWCLKSVLRRTKEFAQKFPRYFAYPHRLAHLEEQAEIGRFIQTMPRGVSISRRANGNCTINTPDHHTHCGHSVREAIDCYRKASEGDSV